MTEIPVGNGIAIAGAALGFGIWMALGDLGSSIDRAATRIADAIKRKGNAP